MITFDFDFMSEIFFLFGCDACTCKLPNCYRIYSKQSIASPCTGEKLNRNGLEQQKTGISLV